MTPFVEIVITFDTKQNAQNLARRLVESRLTACVQVRGPIQSTYRWKGAIETAEEWQCVAKSRRDLFDRIQRMVGDLHSYEVPEILMISIAAANQSYLDWLNGQIAPE